jgi:ubiquitin carboxyl-terminal hydrolase 5/13
MATIQLKKKIKKIGSKLVAVNGPGFTGMRNLGNSCYMNSAMQLLFNLPEFNEKYTATLEQHMQLTPLDPSGDFNLQMAKLGHGLASGKYSAPSPVETDESAAQAHLRAPRGIKPTSFKTLVGRGHVEFSTKRQQDAHEFLIYLFSLIERNLRTDHTTAGGVNPLDSFKFKLMDRFESSQSHQVNFFSF